jgi:hypothetical protein
MVRELSSQPGIRPARFLLCRLRGIADGGVLLTATEPTVIDKPRSTLFHCPNGIEKIAFEAFGFPQSRHCTTRPCPMVRWSQLTVIGLRLQSPQPASGCQTAGPGSHAAKRSRSSAFESAFSCPGGIQNGGKRSRPLSQISQQYCVAVSPSGSQRPLWSGTRSAKPIAIGEEFV